MMTKAKVVKAVRQQVACCVDKAKGPYSERRVYIEGLFQLECLCLRLDLHDLSEELAVTRKELYAVAE